MWCVSMGRGLKGNSLLPALGVCAHALSDLSVRVTRGRRGLRRPERFTQTPRQHQTSDLASASDPAGRMLVGHYDLGCPGCLKNVLQSTLKIN